MRTSVPCLRCRRSLTHPTSVFLEMGKACLDKTVVTNARRWSREEVDREARELLDHLIGVKHQTQHISRTQITMARRLM